MGKVREICEEHMLSFAAYQEYILSNAVIISTTFSYVSMLAEFL